jgi:hypothetical protein
MKGFLIFEGGFFKKSFDEMRVFVIAMLNSPNYREKTEG